MKNISVPGINISEDEKLFLAHIGDMIRIGERDRRPVYTRFLDERQILLSSKYLASVGCTDTVFFGGNADAVRKQLCIYCGCGQPAFDDFPISAAAYSYRNSAKKPKHSDFLGALMSLGLERGMIGDICMDDGVTYVFVCDTALDSVLSLEKVGKTGVKCRRAELSEVTVVSEFKEIRTWLSSMRLDCMLAAAAGMSRDKASAAVRSEGVTVNCVKIFAPDHIMNEGDVFSFRGKGKFRVAETGGISSKGRISVLLEKYL